MSVVPVATPVPVLTEERIELVKRTIAQGATDDELALFLQVVERTGLDPFMRQIHMVKRWDNREQREVASIQVGIDGFRLIAARTGQYQGQEPIVWCGPDRKWLDVWSSDNPPVAARAGVWRAGFTRALYRAAAWKESVQTYRDKNGAWVPTPTWSKMPSLMLGKVAEAAALRAAFPAELSGIYTEEEIATTPVTVELAVDDAGETLISEENVRRLVKRCEDTGVDLTTLVGTATEGRTTDPAELRTADMTAVARVGKELAEALGRPPAEASGGEGERSRPPRKPSPPPTVTIVEDDLSDEAKHNTVVANAALMATRPQVGKIKGEYERLGVDDRKVQLAWTASLLDLGDDAVDSHNNLTKNQATGLIELLTAAETVEALDDLSPPGES